MSEGEGNNAGIFDFRHLRTSRKIWSPATLDGPLRHSATFARAFIAVVYDICTAHTALELHPARPTLGRGDSLPLAPSTSAPIISTLIVSIVDL